MVAVQNNPKPQLAVYLVTAPVMIAGEWQTPEERTQKTRRVAKSRGERQAPILVSAGEDRLMVAEVIMPKATAPRLEWLDLLPDGAPAPSLDELLTRDQVLEDMRHHGLDIDEVTLVYWEKAGILPRAVRRQRDGIVRALYPRWSLPVIREVRAYQAAGRRLRDIAPQTQALARAWAMSAIGWLDPMAESLGAMRAALVTLAKTQERIGVDHPITVAEVRFTDDTGREVLKHTFPLPPDAPR